MVKGHAARTGLEDNDPYGFSVSHILIDKLVLDPAFQVRRNLDKNAIKRYAALYAAGRAVDPILVADVNGVFIVTSGWHRVEALKLVGATHAEARVSAMSRDDALWEAATSNSSHGVPLNRVNW